MKIKKNTFSTLVLELFFPSVANCRKLKIQKNPKIDFPYCTVHNVVVQDSACHTEMASVLSRAVARPLLEKTFHMKIQSRYSHIDTVQVLYSNIDIVQVQQYRYSTDTALMIHPGQAI
jgi:hypothetical protein